MKQTEIANTGSKDTKEQLIPKSYQVSGDLTVLLRTYELAIDVAESTQEREKLKLGHKYLDKSLKCWLEANYDRKQREDHG